MAVTTSTGPRRAAKRAEADWVVRKLTDLIAGMEPGERIPKHTELMDQFQASERVVLHALSLLNDEGKIIRRNGKGTFVAERKQDENSPPPGISLTAADSRTIVAIAKPDHSFFDQCMKTLFRHVESESLQLVCRLVGPRTAEEFESPSGSARPLGFIVFRHDLAPLAAQLQADGNRVVLVGAQSEEMPTDVPTVFGDHETGGELATKYLIDIGHRRIAYSGDIPRQQSRKRGHELAIAKARKAGLVITSSFIDTAMRDEWERDPKLAAQFLRMPGAPTGITVWNDHEAAKLLAILTRAGIRVPEEVSLIGYDNVPESNRVYPALTTIDAGIPQLIRVAVDMLTGAVPPQRSRSVMVLPTLVVRDSTAPPAA